MDKKVIAVISCGKVASEVHFPAFAQMDNIRVKYACDIILQKAQDIKEKYSFVEHAITDYKIALADPEVDAVYVLTPNHAHHTVTMDALRAGKHVFCEKPIAVSYALAEEMAREAEARGKILDIGVCNRYNKSIEMLEQLNREGRFGSIYHIYCSFRAFRSIPGLGGAFTTKEKSGGGVLIDWGIHFFDLIFYILGGAKLKNVTCDAYCEMAKDMKSYKFERMWASQTANIETGTNNVEDFISGYIRTDKASISFNGAWAQNINNDEMFVDFLGDKCGARLYYGEGFELYDGQTLKTKTCEYEMTDMFLSQNKAFIQSITTGEKNRNNIREVLESAKLLDALYQSAKEGREILL